MSKNTRNRILLTALAALLLVVVAVGGTMAWLVDSTEAVTNTFTTAGIDIDLDETEDDWSKKLIPGNTYTKDPVVSINRDVTDVDIWLYVEITDESAARYLSTYDFALDSWKNDLTNEPNVYYIEVKATENTGDGCTKETCTAVDPHWHLITGDTITVNENLVKAGTTTEGALVMPSGDVKLEYKAYAIQSANRTAQEGWDTLNP